MTPHLRKVVPHLTVLALAITLGSCALTRPAQRGKIQEDFLEQLQGPANGQGMIETVWLQINDVYEMLPMEGGTAGGLARVARLEQKLIAENPNTRMIIAGDFFSPSALGAAEVDGRKLNGRQMVDTLAAAGLDVAVFGNHEFDIPEEDFRLRLEESKNRFSWIGGNVLDAKTGKPFAGTTPHPVIEFADQDGDRVRIGILALTIDSSQKPYVKYLEPTQFARKAIQELKKQKADIILAITHQSIEEDRQLVESYPEIDLLMGGHEHVAMRVPVKNSKTGKETLITKADANAKTAWIHALRWDTQNKRLTLASTLQDIGDRSPEDTRITELAEKWVKRAYDGYRAKGFEPTASVTTLKRPLDGRSEVIRKQSTSLSEVLLDALMRQAPEAELALFNSGLVRIDDTVQPGLITEYDILRIAPFPDDVMTAQVTGADLIRIRDYNEKAQGDGMYLQIRSKPALADLDPEKIYRVVMNTYLAGRLRAGLAFSANGKTPPKEDPLHNAKKGIEFRKAIIESLREGS
jgi:5'-nucleotidase/UDP-sugar diphosphatase